MSNTITDNWTTPQGLADELKINRSVVYTWIYKKQIGFKELPTAGSGRKSYLVDRTSRPPLRERGRPA